jgi:hypothetical protein
MRTLGVPLLLMLAACSGVRGLSEAREPLQGDEPAVVRRTADTALKEGRYSDAWNLEAAVGEDRARLEAIALASLEADRGPYEDMLAELRTKFGGLTPAARSRIDAIVTKQMGERQWKAAVVTEITAAEDPPTYAAAWRVYERTPAKDALPVLEAIQKARRDHAESKAPKATK